ncbi:MAG: hypothetical protein SPL19_07355 [Fibrobacter sp.]|jgi:hypothetical protein|nr:hypothetical protein [Fibrobacter sp.]MDY6370422.1 hypothetical protein [Fibrobacter sp.]MDY6390157.1 hypothetical protein [Fibrobacter sp.]
MNRLLFLLAIFFAIPAYAGYFLEKDAAEEEQKAIEIDRGFSFGFGPSATYYLGAFDLGIEGLGAYRFENDFGVSLDISLGISEPVHEAAFAGRYYFTEGDFVDFGVSGVLLKKDSEWKKAPRIFVDYGRNMKPWPHAHFALQAKIRLSYLVGETLGREEMYSTKEVYTTISGQIALVFF